MAKAKALKPNKAAKQKAKEQQFINPFASSSLYSQTQRFMDESPNAKPFQDMATFLTLVIAFFIWRLSAAVTSGREASIGVWSLFSFGTAVIINIWSFFLVMVSAKRGGDIGILKISEEDILRFTSLSGLFGAWSGVLLFQYKPQSSSFYIKFAGVSILNLFWVMVYVRYYW
ncbi:hypothetical protein BGZ98_003875 [Dissophora globulifera]|nr:hypothetical protein BGZ98_003875 [Dissophora globulifera]